MKTILTVDDSRTMRDMLMVTLSNAGYNVIQGVDGIDGLRMLDAAPVPSVIITDINMPRMDGFAFVEAVRKRASLRMTPILVLTTESDEERKARARAVGATGWIVKPFDPAKLIGAINRVSR